jgi:hypothetical protein
MKNIFYFILFVSVSLSITCCVNSDPKQRQNQQVNVADNTVQNYDELAKEYCTCSEEIVLLNKKMQKLASEEKFEEMGDLLSEIDSKSTKQLACKEQIEQKYKTSIDTNKAVLISFKKICPDLGNFIENAKKSDNN